jgi:predicted transcriptional regulator
MTMNDKETVMQVLRELPDSATLEEIKAELAALVAIRQGAKAADEGRVKSHEEVKSLLEKWTSE